MKTLVYLIKKVLAADTVRISYSKKAIRIYTESALLCDPNAAPDEMAEYWQEHWFAVTWKGIKYTISESN